MISTGRDCGADEAAQLRGLKVTGHLCAVSYREAAEAGIDNLEPASPR